MINSILIVGATEETRLKKAIEIRNEKNDSLNTQNDPDFILLDSDTSIGIEKVRDLKRKLSLKPFQSKYKVAYIKNAQNLTIPAQNALLKTLEETGQNSILILSGPSENLLLPTILSRCQIIKISGKPTPLDRSEEEKFARFFAQIDGQSPGQRLLAVSPYVGNRQLASDFCTKALIFLHGRLLKGQNSTKLAKQLNSAQKALSFIEKNVNVKLVMENLFLSW